MAPSTTNSREEDGGETAVRARILDAAFAAFMKNGYAATSTLEIATRARVSKREIYATVGNKQEMLIACISERAGDWAWPPPCPCLMTARPSHACWFLSGLGSSPRSAIQRSLRYSGLRSPRRSTRPRWRGRSISIGREASRAALRNIMAQAQASGLLKGRVAELAEQFSGLLWGNLMISLLLGVAERPNPRAIAARARDAAAAFLQLHPPPDGAATPA